MASPRTRCPHCQKSFKASLAQEGKNSVCTSCQKKFVIRIEGQPRTAPLPARPPKAIDNRTGLGNSRRKPSGGKKLPAYLPFLYGGVAVAVVAVLTLLIILLSRSPTTETIAGDANPPQQGTSNGVEPVRPLDPGQDEQGADATNDDDGKSTDPETRKPPETGPQESENEGKQQEGAGGSVAANDDSLIEVSRFQQGGNRAFADRANRFRQEAARHIGGSPPRFPEYMLTDVVGTARVPSPRYLMDYDNLPMIGIDAQAPLSLDNISDVLPVYERDEKSLVLADEGYAVGGLNVAFKNEWIVGIQCIYMKIVDDHLDTSDTRTSRWVGFSSEGQTRTITSDGRLVIGVYYHKGSNSNSIGLICLPEAGRR